MCVLVRGCQLRTCFHMFLWIFCWKRSNLKFTQKSPGTSIDPGCQEAVDTAAALILQRQWRRRQRRSWISKLVGLGACSVLSTPSICVFLGVWMIWILWPFNIGNMNLLMVCWYTCGQLKWEGSIMNHHEDLWTSITEQNQDCFGAQSHVFGHAARHKSVKGMEKLRRLLSSKMGGEKTKSFAVLSRFVCLFWSDDIHHLSNLLRDVSCIDLRRVESSSKDMFANFAIRSLMQMSSQDFHTPLHEHGSQQQIFFGSSLKFTTTSSAK